ncbi:MAG TPA: hypothetical protein VKS19_10045 [Verrucomicrobiae bacterium]|nr:hypothetical protein [Verrucomicrobiae bacterium]
MFYKLLPQLLRAADVARLTAFITASQQDDNLPAVKSIINAEPRPKRDPQFKHTAACILLSRRESNHSSNGTNPF